MRKICQGLLGLGALFHFGAAAATFTVSKTNDVGSGSLREAMFLANANPGADLISFSIPGSGVLGINPMTPLPDIVEAVTIDGYTQPGASANTLEDADNGMRRIALVGLFGDTESAAFTIRASHVVIRGLTIQGAPGVTGGGLGLGIWMRGGSSNRVEGCRLGPGLRHGLLMGSNAFAAVIGGTNPAARNLILGNQEGITMRGSSSNHLVGNLIGTDETGRAAFGNWAGVLISGAAGNVIGGVKPGERNVISGNGSTFFGLQGGIHLYDSIGTVIQGNFIGTDATGTSAVSNSAEGISLHGGNSNLIGGTLPGAGNVISANGNGIFCEAGQVSALGVIQGNLIGTDRFGTNRLGNAALGIGTDGSYRLQIGGNDAGSGNVIGANGFFGVHLGFPAVDGSIIQGNFIGTDRSGGLDLGNAWVGVSLGSPANLLGGNVQAAGNLIAFNHSSGVFGPGTILGNSIYSNWADGIALGGSDFNDSGDIDPPQNYPELMRVVSDSAETRVSGVLRSRPGGTFRVEFFDNDECDSIGGREGRRYLGFLLVNPDETGSAALSFVQSPPLPAGHYMTATATGTEWGTSEFSPCRPVLAHDTIDLALAITDLSDPVSVASNVTYLITVTNLGPADATSITVSNIIPAGTSFISATVSQGTCAHSAGIVACDLGDLHDGGVAGITLTIHPTQPGSFETTACVTAVQSDHDLSNNNASEHTQVGYADVAVDVIEHPDLVVAGQVATYRLVVTNRGPDGATDVRLSVGEFYSVFRRTATATRGICSNGLNSIECEFGGLVMGEAVTVTITGIPSEVGFVSLNATATATEVDPAFDNNHSFIATVVEQGPGLLQFSNDSWQTNEGAGEVAVTVVRTGGAIGSVTVDFDTEVLTAQAGLDYLPVSGTLAFADGETEKTILVPLLDDSMAECNEALRVSLSNPAGGAQVLGRARTEILIVEDDLLVSGTSEAVSVVPGEVTTTGNQFSYGASMSSDGRFVAFSSSATDLTANANANGSKVFVRDLAKGVTTLASANTNGSIEGEVWSGSPAISNDGALVAFESLATDLVPMGMIESSGDIFIRDVSSATTRLVSVNNVGTGGGDGASSEPVISGDGSTVAFLSHATDIGSTVSTNRLNQLFARHLASGVTQLASVNRFGTGGDAPVFQPVLSDDGRFVVFVSAASHLVTNDDNALWDVFARDLTQNTTTMVSVNSSGTAAGNGSSKDPRLSADGRRIVFTSSASDLVVGDTNETDDVFLRDLVAGTTTLISVNHSGAGSTGWSGRAPTISADGRLVAFSSLSPDLVAGDTNGLSDVFVRDVLHGTTILVSAACNGPGSGNGASDAAVISRDGRYVAFESYSTDLVPGNFATDPFGNHPKNIFVRDLSTGTTVLASQNHVNGGAADEGSFHPLISADGQVVAFESRARDLVADDANSAMDVFTWRFGSLPSLSIALTNDSILVRWPSFSPGYVLEVTGDLSSGAGWDIAPGSTTNDGIWKTRTMSQNLDELPLFFRLRRP